MRQTKRESDQHAERGRWCASILGKSMTYIIQACYKNLTATHLYTTLCSGSASCKPRCLTINSCSIMSTCEKRKNYAQSNRVRRTVITIRKHSVTSYITKRVEIWERKIPATDCRRRQLQRINGKNTPVILQSWQCTFHCMGKYYSYSSYRTSAAVIMASCSHDSYQLHCLALPDI